MKIKQAINEVPNIVFISDQHPSIKKNINIAFSNAMHGICMHYLKQNLHVKFKEIQIGAIVELFARFVDCNKFNYFMNKIH